MRRDHYSFRVLIIEAIIFSIAAYSWLGFGEFYMFTEDVHLSPFLITGFGLFVGALATLLLVGIIFFSLRGSSRSHRIIIESAIVLGMSIPMGGIQLVSDLNTSLDKSNPAIVEARVIRLYEQRHRGRKGRVYYTYHLDIELISETTEFNIPRHIEIDHSKFIELGGAQAVTLTIGRGYLKYPWFKKIEDAKKF